MLSIWALFRKSAAAGSAALWGVALALAAREWTGGSVTVRSARGRVPLLHDPSILLQEVRGAKVEEGGGGRGSADGSRGEGVGYGGGDGVPATVAGGVYIYIYLCAINKGSHDYRHLNTPILFFIYFENSTCFQG